MKLDGEDLDYLSKQVLTRSTRSSIRANIATKYKKALMSF